jgi:hypothetical protein
MRRALTLLAIAAVAAFAVGCEDDDPDPRSDFIKQADRICLRSGIRPTAVPNDLGQAAEQLAVEARLRSAVHTKLQALKPPDELARDYGRFLRLTDRVARDLRRMSGVARAGDQAELAELGRRTTLVETERMHLGERMGFRRCGRAITEPVRGEG